VAVAIVTAVAAIATAIVDDGWLEFQVSNGVGIFRIKSALGKTSLQSKCIVMGFDLLWE